jgi:hypothetical protein
MPGSRLGASSDAHIHILDTIYSRSPPALAKSAVIIKGITSSGRTVAAAAKPLPLRIYVVVCILDPHLGRKLARMGWADMCTRLC